MTPNCKTFFIGLQPNSGTKSHSNCGGDLFSFFSWFSIEFGRGKNPTQIREKTFFLVLNRTRGQNPTPIGVKTFFFRLQARFWVDRASFLLQNNILGVDERIDEKMAKGQYLNCRGDAGGRVPPLRFSVPPSRFSVPPSKYRRSPIEI